MYSAGYQDWLLCAWWMLEYLIYFDHPHATISFIFLFIFFKNIFFFFFSKGPYVNSVFFSSPYLV